MKLMAAADIHGSSRFCALLVEAFFREKADRLLLLGDILASGGDSVEETAALLNEISEHIICVAGNGDQGKMTPCRLNFPCQDEYTMLRLGKHLIFATHGHIYNEYRLPPLDFDILLHGHTHVPACREHEGYLHLNPGSVSRPREGSKNSYLILEEDIFIWKDLNGHEMRRYPCR